MRLASTQRHLAALFMETEMTAVAIPKLNTFSFAPGLNLRVLEVNGDPWFVAKDVCDALALAGYASHNCQLLDTDEVAVVHKSDITDDRLTVLFGKRAPSTTIINESGLYSLILKSRKPEAKAFKKWVTSEVLASIRKHGGYLAPAVAQEVVESPEAFMARAVLMAHETINNLKVLTKGLESAASVSA
jgi:prophage antirepressor-like protein